MPPKKLRELVWNEFSDIVPAKVPSEEFARWQGFLDLIPAARTPAQLKDADVFSDSHDWHLSTSPMTQGQVFPNIPTLPDYIPLHLPPIVYVALFHSYGTGDHRYLARSFPIYGAINSHFKSDRARGALSKLTTHFNTTKQQPRCPTRLPESGKARYKNAKSDNQCRFYQVKWSMILDYTAFHDALAMEAVVLAAGKKSFVDELQQIAKKRQAKQPLLTQFFAPLHDPLAPSAPIDFSNSAEFPESTYRDAASEGLRTLATLVVARDRKFSLNPGPMGLIDDPSDASLQLVPIFASIPRCILMSLIEGTLAKDKRYDDVVRDELQKLLLLSEGRPGIYVVWVADRHSLSPSPNVLWKAIGLVKLYCTDKPLSAEEAQIVYLMDASLYHKQQLWTEQDLRTTFHRRWLGSNGVDILEPRKTEERIQSIMIFCMHLDHKLKAICDTNPSAADNPTDFYLSYAGYSQNCTLRMQHHITGDSKNNLMSLLMGALRVIDGDNYKLETSVVMLPWKKGQASLAEAGIARLTNSSYAEGTGFNLDPAGFSIIDSQYTEEEWEKWLIHAFEEYLEYQCWDQWSPYVNYEG